MDEKLRRVARLSIAFHHVKHLCAGSGHACRAARDVGYLRAIDVEVPSTCSVLRDLELIGDITVRWRSTADLWIRSHTSVHHGLRGSVADVCLPVRVWSVEATTLIQTECDYVATWVGRTQ
jgi:hypothetical protein